MSIGRHGSLNPQRKEAPSVLCANDGIPKNLIEIKKEGVLYYHDLRKAEDVGAYKSTSNSEEYPNDYNSIVAYGMRGWNGVKDDVFGMVTLTSNKRNKLLKIRNVEMFMTLGEMLTRHYTSVLSLLESENSKDGFVTNLEMLP